MNACNSGVMCPTCGEGSRYLTDWKFSGLNDSVFNYVAKFHECPGCGLVFIANISDEKLARFYEKECVYFDSPHFDITAPENTRKFEHYKEILESAGLNGTQVTDIGCGRGGFLIWLRNNGWQADCQGVDIDLRSIPHLGSDTNGGMTRLSFHEGRAVTLPFEDGSKSLLTYFHVLEHIRDVQRVLKEAFRVLNDGGHILIEVPDAERYDLKPIGTAFWLSIREHVNHFSPKSLADAVKLNGFDVVSITRKMLPTPEFSYPSLVILARKSFAGNGARLQYSRDIASFVLKSRRELFAQAASVIDFSRSFSALTFWGCSCELFSLLPILDKQAYSICDSSRLKQDCRFEGISIVDPKCVSKNGALIIAPYLHGRTIEKAAIDLGWTKEAIYHLN